jgi:hypothetical protein
VVDGPIVFPQIGMETTGTPSFFSLSLFPLTWWILLLMRSEAKRLSKT